MATKDDITEMVKYHKTKKVFEPQYLGGKTVENAKNLCLHSLTIVNLIK